MLSLHNVSKTYVTKAKTETQALKNVSLDIASRGMVFILGKSGSGKSTLLNLLGGLDAPTNGEIFVDGVSMQQFSQSDYANYRNNYVGFIFQEFNLLADFNVRDNVALALRLTKADDIDVKVSDALKRVELSDDYLNRRIDEMSGGEKQRIAIARALIKDSKLILADEPTGNLDSATGESIWNILKSLSRERLVVVVSHDRESAEKYADRIIEIADGQVISDNGEQPTTKTVNQPQSATKSRLSFMTCLKMGYNNLRLRKAKTVSVILVAIFSILSILITQMCLSFSPEAALAEYMTKYNVDYFTVAQGYVDSYNMFSRYGKVLKNNTKQYVADNSRYIYNGLIESKQDILDFGFSFVGEALEIDDVSYYTTSSAIENCYEGGYGLVEVDGEYVTIIKEFHPIEYLIGKKVKLEGSYFTKDSILAGVIKTSNIDSSLTMLEYSVLPRYFYNRNFDGLYTPDRYTFNDYNEKNVILHLGDKQFDDKMTIIDGANRYLTPSGNVIVTANGIWSKSEEIQLADNEIILPYEIYAQMFNTESKWYFISTDFKTVLNMPKEIGQTFSLKFCEYGTDDLYVDYGEVKLAGISFAENRYNDDKIQIIVNHNFLRQILRDFDSTTLLIQASSVKKLGSFAMTLRRNYDGFIKNAGITATTEVTPQGTTFIAIADMAYDFEQTITFVSFIFLAMGAILMVVLILLVINLISFSIANRKKEIGILSAIGASNKDITSIFLLETSLIAAISFVIILVLSFIFVLVFNVVFSNIELLSVLFPFLRVDILTVAMLIVMSFGLLLLAALIPIRKIIKLKPIDAIRNV